MAPVRDIMQNLPPLLSTIHDQTGIAPPSWVAQMPAGNRDGESLIKQHSTSNGVVSG